MPTSLINFEEKDQMWEGDGDRAAKTCVLPRGQNGVILAHYPFCATRTSSSSNQTSMFKFHPVTIPPFYYVTVYPKEVDMGTRVAGTPIVPVHGRTCSCKCLLEVLRSFIVLVLTGWESFHWRNNSFQEHNTLIYSVSWQAAMFVLFTHTIGSCGIPLTPTIRQNYLLSTLAPKKSFYLVVLCRRKLYVSISNRVTLQTSDSLKSPFSYKHPL